MVEIPNENIVASMAGEMGTIKMAKLAFASEHADSVPFWVDLLLKP